MLNEKIILVEEQKPVNIQGNVIYNTIVSETGRFFVKKGINILKSYNVKMQYYSENFLEEIDLFHYAEGYRISGKELEKFLAIYPNKNDIKIITLEQLEEQRKEQKEKKKQEELERYKKYEIAKEECRKYREWQENLTKGLVYTTVYNLDNVKKERIYPTINPDDNVWYECITEDGIKFYLCYYGNASKVYAPANLIKKWDDELFNQNGGLTAELAFYLWKAKMSDFCCYGHDYYKRLCDKISWEEIINELRKSIIFLPERTNDYDSYIQPLRESGIHAYLVHQAYDGKHKEIVESLKKLAHNNYYFFIDEAENIETDYMSLYYVPDIDKYIIRANKITKVQKITSNGKSFIDTNYEKKIYYYENGKFSYIDNAISECL